MNLKLYIYLPFILTASIIFFLSGQSNLPIKMSFSLQDKVMHFLAFFVLGYTCLRICFYSRIKFYKSALLSIFICTLYGLSDEIHQSFVPNRVFDWADLFADFLGCTTAALIGSHFYKLDVKIKRKIKV